MSQMTASVQSTSRTAETARFQTEPTNVGLPDITALLPSDLVAHHLRVHGQDSAVAGDFILADGTRLHGIVRRPALPKAA